MPVTLALERWKQEDQKFEANLDRIKPCFKKTTTTKKKKNKTPFILNLQFKVAFLPRKILLGKILMH